ncbi:MAG: TldD/PmbA family protein [Candidatus Dormibacteria bacterium]
MSADVDELLSLADRLLLEAGAEGAEVRAVAHRSGLTRFARNQIHQNVAEEQVSLRLRLVRDGRVGVAATRGQTDIARLVEAADAARLRSPAAEVAPLPSPQEETPVAAAFADSTAAATPEWRADQVAVIAAAASAAGIESFGALETAATATCVVNGRGLRRHARTTSVRLSTVCRGADGGGYADRCAADIENIDSAGCAGEVVTTTLRNQAAMSLEPGILPVVLAPYAIAELVGHLSDMGFSALAAQEQRSFMRPGERLVAIPISISDDATASEGMPFPFDDEGVTARPVTCIERGVCRDHLHDSATALRAGVGSTGHALPMPNTWGPYGRHLVMAPGTASLEEMISSCERGLLVTRFWYVRNVHVLRTTITGMTREGTFLIENGRIVRPVRDLRFTQSIIDALNDVRAVGRERSLHVEEGGRALLVPALHLGHFEFTS